MHEPLPPPSQAPHDGRRFPTPGRTSPSRCHEAGEPGLGPAHGSIPYQLATSEGPDQGTSLFVSDATLPQFMEPSAVVFSPPPGVVVRPYTSIEHFLPFYAQQRFGGLPELPAWRDGPVARAVPADGSVGSAHGRAGAESPRCARFSFSFDEGPRRVQVLLFGSCTTFGPIWFADVHGISTVGAPEAFAQPCWRCSPRGGRARPSFSASWRSAHGPRRSTRPPWR